MNEQVAYRMYVNYPAEEDRRSSVPHRKDGERVQNLEVHWRLSSQDVECLPDTEGIAASGLDP